MPASISMSASGRFLLSRLVSGTDLRWHQSRAGQPDQVWSLGAARQEAPIVIDIVESDATSEDMAVLVSLNQDVEEALRESADEVPAFRGFVRVAVRMAFPLTWPC
ncbi:MAG: hypothetical protein V7607_340 [Solirubrobacteraceae bacterium]